ncbi:MAG: PH domain-containing protein [Gemmatimonadota bacterium]|nr:MAG: PH domain-containing protein [Gemmatimonadota bacterium]
MKDLESGETWQRLHPVTPLLRAVQLLYAFVIAAVVTSLGSRSTLIFVLAIMGLIAAWITLAYLRFRYRLSEESLIILHGVFIRKRRVIPRSRIQNVDLRAGVLQQIFGTTTARIETAGGQTTEAILHVVSRSEGARLRKELVALSRRAPPTAVGEAARVAAVSGPPFEPTETLAEASRQPQMVYRVTPLQLVIAGATSNRAGLLVGALLGGDFLFDFVPTDWLLRRVLPPELFDPETAMNGMLQIAQRDLQAFLLGLGMLVAFFGLAGWAISVLTSVVRYFDFSFTQSGGELKVSYGLLTRREKGFRRSRIQNVQIEESLLRRWLGFASLHSQTAGYGQMKADERMETLTPITRASELAPHLEAAFPGFRWEEVEWRPSHPRARRRLFVRRALVILVATLLLAPVSSWALLLLLAMVPAWFLAAAHYRHLGHARLGEYILVREGLWNRRTHIVPVRKIQALYFRQSPFQRRLDLGTLTLETAGNPIEWHAPRSIDLGTSYGVELMGELAAEVTETGLTF